MSKLLLLMSLIVSGTFTVGSTATLANPPVETQPVETTTDAITFYSSGLVTNKAQSRLSFKTSGIIQKLTVDEGQHVKKGDLLAQLDLSEIRAQKRQAQADVKQTDLDVQRLEKLVGQRVAPKEKLDNALIRQDKARATLNIAAFNLKLSQIKAPADGIIITKHTEKNEWVNSGEPILVFSPDSQGWVVKAGLIDREAVYVNIGDQTTIELDAYPGHKITGVVSEMAVQANKNTGLFEIEVRIKDQQLRLMSGLYAHINVHPVQQPVLYRIPTSSLVSANGKTATVAQMNPISRNIELKTVKLHSLSTDSVYISAGLNSEWPVVLGTPYNLRAQFSERLNNGHIDAISSAVSDL